MDYTVGGILQARIQERIAVPICLVFIMENCWTCVSNLHQVFVAINSLPITMHYLSPQQDFLKPEGCLKN